ncbi:unnamed protein product [Rhizophagus irregularis]|nr:unnamed protein product [Rhizophagus irregularis]CAB4414691.1 unnamed protein product [Rhizophagus irregularis]
MVICGIGVLIVNFLALNQKRITVSVSEIKEERKQSDLSRINMLNHITINLVISLKGIISVNDNNKILFSSDDVIIQLTKF